MKAIQPYSPIPFIMVTALLLVAGCVENSGTTELENDDNSTPGSKQEDEKETGNAKPPTDSDDVLSTDSDNQEADKVETVKKEDVDDKDAGEQIIVPIETAQEMLAQLQPVDSCDQLLEELQEKTIRDAEEITSQNLERALWMLEEGSGCYYPIYEADGMSAASSAAAGASGSAPPNTAVRADDESASEYSTTNTQEIGVDEADFIKNDGSYIYLLADGKLQIIDAWPASETSKISTVDIEGTPKKLFVDKDRAVVYSSLDPLQQIDVDPYADYFIGAPIGTPAYEKECTYGYNCEFSGDNRALKITAFDISDKTDPVLLRETRFSGSYLNSRRINDIVHTVVTFPEITLEGVTYWPEAIQYYLNTCRYQPNDFPFTEDELRFMFDKLNQKNQEIINATTITDFIPSITDTVYVDGQPTEDEGLLQSCANFYLSGVGDGKSLLSLISFEMDEVGEIGATTIVGKPGAVYASMDSLYIAVRHYSSNLNTWFFDDSVQDPEATTIHKFSLDSESIATEYIGSGVAKGRILNQFSMDEHLGYLRIATTTGHVPSPDVHSTLSVIQEQEGALEVVGVVDNIAPTEDIRSVRFDGETGFVVTFKKTDPLFVIDLSDPEHPTIKGELKIPGFSTYMHLMDDSHLLTIGYDADDQGSFAWFQGIQLQIIDVSNPEDPQLIHKEVTGMRGTSSEAATNHLAFNYFPERDLLAIPMTVCEDSSEVSGGGGSYGERMTFSGLLVFRVTLQDGFSYLGGVPHQEPETEYSYTGVCSNWWTNSNSVVQRSIFMSDTESEPVQDYVYSVAMDLMNVSDLTDLENPIAQVELME